MPPHRDHPIRDGPRLPPLASPEAGKARYDPIASYGVIGDCRSAALVGPDGSIDWWSPSRFDGPSVFGALLDRHKGGHFSIRAGDRAISSMRYLPETNVIETRYRTHNAEVVLTDFAVFPDDSGTRDPLLVRRVHCLRGPTRIDVEFAPRFGYGAIHPRVTPTPTGIVARGHGETLHLHCGRNDFRMDGRTACLSLDIEEGERMDFILRHRTYEGPSHLPFEDLPNADALEARTLARWQTWSARTVATGPYAEAVKRSALVLKLLTYAPTGAIVAAATTSLPEEIGGVRNWDYRYTWVRDAAFSARALFAVGHPEEATDFVNWLLRVAGDDPRELRIMYGVGGERDLREVELEHLSGYRSSKPVRIGNGACEQTQLDVYGELFEAADACRELGYDVESPRWRFFRALADHVADNWHMPDSGIWEMRSAPKHFVLSKAMAWCALDRAIAAAEASNLPGDVTRWRREADAIKAEVMAKGWDEELGAFRQAYEAPLLDASNLLLPLIGFIDARDPRMMRTVDATLESLTVDDLVYRYLDADDGVEGGEGTFAYCTFWLVEVLAMQGRTAEATRIFDRMLERASHLGLFAEEIEPRSGEHLGNFPQAFPHIGLITAAMRLNGALHHGVPQAPAEAAHEARR